MKCLNCGGILSDGAKFCKHCGSNVEAQINEKANRCPKCGYEYAADAVFCNNCGSKLDTAAETQTPSETEKELVCPNCKKPANPTAAFCRSCGNNFSENPAVEKEEEAPLFEFKPQALADEPQKTASEVKPPVESEAPLAAEAIKTEEPVKEAAVKKSSSNKMTAILIALIIALVAAIAGGIYAAVYFELIPISDEDDELEEVFSDEEEEKDKDKKEEEPEEKVKINEIDSEVIADILDGTFSYTDFGIYVYNSENDYEFEYNADRKLLASAMGQVVVLDMLSEAVDKYDLDVDDDDYYFSYLKGNGKQAPHSPKQDGKYLTIRSYIEDIAMYGDNNKLNSMIDYLGEVYDEYSGFDAISDYLSDNSYYDTEINRKTFIDQSLVDNTVEPNQTTAKEIGKIFYNLLENSNYGDRDYMNGIFASINDKGEPIGILKFVPSEYDSCCFNAATNQSTNNIAVINNGDTDIVVAILSQTSESKIKDEDGALRLQAQGEILNYILETQFETGE